MCYFFYFIAIFFDFRDCVNVALSHQNRIYCKGCSTWIGFYHRGMVELFYVVVLQNPIAYMGTRTGCMNGNCNNPTCLRFISREGVRAHNSFQSRQSLDLSSFIFTPYRVVVHTGHVDDSESACVTPMYRETRRMYTRLEPVFDTAFRVLPRRRAPITRPSPIATEPVYANLQENAFSDIENIIRSAVQSLDVSPVNPYISMAALNARTLVQTETRATMEPIYDVPRNGMYFAICNCFSSFLISYF